jgi:enoyl-CoA hydratase/carnithine racemase
MKAISFEDYSGKYESLQMTRQDGILEVTLHTNGKSLVFSRTVHEELGFAFADIAADRDNKVVILTGTGETFCTDFDPESFKSFNGLGKNITAIGWDQTVWRGQHNIAFLKWVRNNSSSE